MPGFIGKKLCPELVIVKPRFDEYTAVSERVRYILAQYDSKFTSVGLDEAYLDLTHYIYTLIDGIELLKTKTELPDHSQPCHHLPQNIWDFGEKVTKEIRDKIYQSTQLTASAGIATNKMLAKIASDIHKPNGQYFVKPCRDDIIKFIGDLPVRKVCFS